jgi:tRNA 2-thiouridine synthesizing protein B
MPTLHQVMASEPHLLKQLSQVISSEDSVILLGDGCYQLSRWSLANSTFAMTEDLAMRGLETKVAKSITSQDWVNMTLKHTNVMTWK